MAERSSRTVAPQRTAPRQTFVHLRNGSGVWCGSNGNLPTITEANYLLPHQQLCAKCQMEKEQAEENTPPPSRKKTRLNEASLQMYAEQKHAANDSQPVKTFKQRQAEEIQAAAAARRAPKASVTAPVRGTAPLRAVAPTKGAPTNGVVNKPRRVVETRVVGKRNCTTVAEALIREGKSNEEVWDVIQVEFNLPDKHRGYPAWYRSRLRRAGEDV